jgi:hypothetical protein
MLPVFAIVLNKYFAPFQLLQKSDVNETLSLQQQFETRMRLFAQEISKGLP